MGKLIDLYNSAIDIEVEKIDDLIDTLTDDDSLIMADEGEEAKKGEEANSDLLKLLRTERSTWKNAKSTLQKMSLEVSEDIYSPQERKLKNKIVKAILNIRKLFRHGK